MAKIVSLMVRSFDIFLPQCLASIRRGLLPVHSNVEVWQDLGVLVPKRERKKKFVRFLSSVKLCLFMLFIYLFIYQDIKDLLNPAKTNLKIHENAQVG